MIGCLLGGSPRMNFLAFGRTHTRGGVLLPRPDTSLALTRPLPSMHVVNQDYDFVEQFQLQLLLLASVVLDVPPRFNRGKTHTRTPRRRIVFLALLARYAACLPAGLPSCFFPRIQQETKG